VENLDDISKAVTFAAKNESRYEKKTLEGVGTASPVLHFPKRKSPPQEEEKRLRQKKPSGSLFIANARNH